MTLLVLTGCTECEPTEFKDIYSSRIKDAMGGGFLLGMGSFNTETYYYFYSKEGGGLLLDKVEAEHTTIFEDAVLNPYFVKVISRSTSICNNELHVPKGTIYQELNLNLSDL